MDSRDSASAGAKGGILPVSMATDTLKRLVPDRRLFLDGQQAGVEVAAKISRITVELSDAAFNEARLVFTDPDQKLIDGQQLSAGTAIAVELGFLGKLVPVFDGEVVSVEPRFVRDHPPSLIVRALEPLHRLALAPKTRSFQDATAAQVVQQVAKEHGLSGQAPGGGSASHLLQPNVSDYTLLTKIAARTGNRIMLDGKKLKLAPPPSFGEVEVVPGGGLKRLKVTLRTTEQVPKVVVRGWDNQQKKVIVGQAQPKGEAKDGAEAAKPFGITDFFIEGVLVHDTAEAESIAKATVQRIAERYATASGELVGNAEVVPGKVLAFDKLGEGLDGKYRVTSARHEFDKRGYRVFFEATRVAKKKPAAKFKAPQAPPPGAQPAKAKNDAKTDEQAKKQAPGQTPAQKKERASVASPEAAAPAPTATPTQSPAASEATPAGSAPATAQSDGMVQAGPLDEAKQWAAKALGYVELVAGDVGIDHLYPVKSYQYKMSNALVRGSRIDSEKGYEALRKEGVKSIVDLRAEGPGDAGFGAERAGLVAHRIPVIDNTPPTTDQILDFLDFVTEQGPDPKTGKTTYVHQPVYFHCEAGKGRTGVFAACARMALEGWTPQQALAEAEKFGDSLVDQQDFILQFGKDLAAGKYPGYPTTVQ